MPHLDRQGRRSEQFLFTTTPPIGTVSPRRSVTQTPDIAANALLGQRQQRPAAITRPGTSQGVIGMSTVKDIQDEIRRRLRNISSGGTETVNRPFITPRRRSSLL